MASALFSKVQQRVLAVLFGNPGRSFYATEIIRLARSGSGAVQRELARLEASGLVTTTRVGKQKHFQANPGSPLFEELRGMAAKTFGVADILLSALVPVAPQIDAAFVYGSVAKGTDTASSDIDVLVISDTLAYGELFAVLENASKQLGRPVAPTIYSKKELEERGRDGNAFVQRILSQPKIWLVRDDEYDPLESLAATGRSLHREPPHPLEFRALIQSGETRLADAERSEISIESRFDLAYNASHALCLAALRYRGYRAVNRYIVFQALPHTLALGPEVWRVLDRAHKERNRTEYEGTLFRDERLLQDVILACKTVLEALRELPELPA